MVTTAQCKKFISEIAPLIQKYVKKYGYGVPSAIIAQACLESAYGTSTKAKKHNYFGLKYRKNRLTCHSGYFTDGSSEEYKVGVHTPITTDWYAFADMEHGVEGYFQFINVDTYKNVKGVTNPETYLKKLRADGYATSSTYVENNMNVIKKWDLTSYDNAMTSNDNETKVNSTSTTVNKTAKTVTAKVNTSTSALNMRNADGKKIASIPKGKTVTVIKKSALTMKISGKSYTMCKVKYGDKTGYVVQKYLKF